MKQVIANATILHEEDLEVVNGYVIVKDKTIKEIGEGSYFGKNTDVKGGIIFPSFMNSHIHIGDSVAKDLGAYRDIEERVGRGGIKQQKLDEKSSDVPKAIRATLKKMLIGGTTAFSDFREGGLKGINQLKSALKTPMDCRIMGRPNSDDLINVLENCDGIGISSVKDYTEGELKKISRAVKESSKLLGVHVGEVEDDLDKALAIKPDFVVHLTNVDSEGLERITDANIPVILCPRANAMLGVGIPRLKELFTTALVALGTDNVMVNSPDMFREMEFTFKIIRGIYKDHMFDAKEVLKAATINGRRIFGLPDNSIV
ncbi:MAG: amidohydrolase family protein, partial [Candidatus Hydrothermarchaeales archaeon]